MAITFDLSKLTSKIVRSDIGTRIIKGMELTTTGENKGGAVGGIISTIFNGIASLRGFLIEKIGGFIKFSWTGFWSWVTVTRQFIWNFNWNATDAELDASIKAKWTALAGQAGGTVGNALGYIACGIIPGMVIFAFNEPLGAVVLADVTAEFLEEFFENLGVLLLQALNLGTQILITETFKSVRKLIKSQSKLVKKLFGDKAEKAVQAWGSKDSKPWSFASNNEENLDKQFGTEGAWREFAEEAQEEADEACTEAGYVVANAVDTFLASDMLAKKIAPPLGGTKYVEITPNRDIPDEKIVLGGREELLKPVIIQTLATYEQFNGRDLGTIYGTPASDMPERRHKPEVVLKFYRKMNHKKEKGEITAEQLFMQISFRLMSKSKADFSTDDYLKTLANAIHKEFATPPFKINKGKHTYTYCDFEKGYQFKLDVKDEVEAKRVIKKVLDIQQHTFNDDAFRVGSKPINIPSLIGEKVTIRGKIEELPIKGGKEGIVTFSYAYLNLGIALPPINLVDLTGKKRNVVYVSTGK